MLTPHTRKIRTKGWSNVGMGHTEMVVTTRSDTSRQVVVRRPKATDGPRGERQKKNVGIANESNQVTEGHSVDALAE